MKLSVSMITYGQEAFIAQAINSVLMQKCNFDFELIISNDCSPDNTDAIINEIIATHPHGHKIQYHHHQNNIGAIPNFIFSIEAAKGQYVAICEGDDYWTDPLKLQRQVDFLDQNPDYALCFHQGTSYYQNSKKTEDFISNKNVLNDKVTPIEIIKTGGNLCPTDAIVYRNYFEKFPKFFYETQSGDRALALLLMLKGKFKFINENMSVYRIHDGGISRNLSTEKLIGFKESNIQLLENFDVYSNFKFHSIIQDEISSQVRNIIIYNSAYLWKPQYLKKIKIKHLILAIGRLFINIFKS
ncbi:glycosyltransferase family 2 protein [Flavobacterium branchiophilum]|uniref:Glycosyl transferase n=1 Tax=Flavobacterium branchiophilum TaxID=55197 RepID=A0A2H3KYA3_9FLAO|nr:glycosyltransferase [Flavobacterium branchiophilum]PDS24630.1 glycosyl transferase [Flavobacterium branchiophilum]